MDDTSKILSDYGVCNHSTIWVCMGIIGGAKKRKVLTLEEKKQREENQTQEMQFRVGPLDRDRLMTDNQVVRALEILNSYDIFKSLNS